MSDFPKFTRLVSSRGRIIEQEKFLFLLKELLQKEFLQVFNILLLDYHFIHS